MKLSIITVNLNNADGLRKTIESVVNQTSHDFEYIVVDGASTDGSVDVIEQYSGKISYWISEPDAGIYQAMNKGILKAQGEYCLFLNAGDYLCTPSVIREIFDFNFEDEIIYGNIVNIKNHKRTVGKGIANSEIGLYDLIYNRINHQACFIKRNLFLRFGLYSEKYTIASDWKFFLDTIITGNVTVRYVDKEISYFDQEGISSLNRSKAYEETMYILNKTIPSRILLSCYQLRRYKESRYIRFYDKLVSNKVVMRLYKNVFRKV